MARVQLLGLVWVGLIHYTRFSLEANGGQRLLKQSDVKWLAHTYKLTRTAASALSLNEMQPLSLLLFCSWDRIYALMLIITAKNRAICVSILSDDIVKH